MNEALLHVQSVIFQVRMFCLKQTNKKKHSLQVNMRQYKLNK